MNCMCSAINMKWVMSDKIICDHYRIFGNASSADNPRKWSASGRLNYDQPFKTVRSIMERMQEGHEKLGGPYEECNNI